MEPSYITLFLHNEKSQNGMFQALKWNEVLPNWKKKLWRDCKVIWKFGKKKKKESHKTFPWELAHQCFRLRRVLLFFFPELYPANRFHSMDTQLVDAMKPWTSVAEQPVKFLRNLQVPNSTLCALAKFVPLVAKCQPLPVLIGFEIEGKFFHKRMMPFCFFKTEDMWW